MPALWVPKSFDSTFAWAWQRGSQREGLRRRDGAVGFAHGVGDRAQQKVAVRGGPEASTVHVVK